MNNPQGGPGQALEAVPIQAEVTAYEAAYLPQKSTVDHMLRVAGYLASAGITPRALDTPEKVLGAWLKGIEMQIPPMLALQHIYIVDGKAGISAELQLSLIRRAGIKIRVVKQDDEICVVEASRVGSDGEEQKHTDQFTYAEAKAANLTNKFNWKSYRRDMLRARATTRCLRFFAPDVTHGCMLADELDAFRDGLTDLPAGTEKPPATEDPPKRIDAPDVKSSSRSSTGDTRVRGEAAMREPEVDAEAGAGERADAGGSSSEETGEWQPGEECFGDKPKPKGIADARRLEGWKAFVTGTAIDDHPPELGERILKWWKEGWNAAAALASEAIFDRDVESDDQAEELAREGAEACLDHQKLLKDCPYKPSTRDRFFWMTGYQAAAATMPDEEPPSDQGDSVDEEAAPPEEKPAAPAPEMDDGVRSGLLTQVAESFAMLGFGPDVGKDVIERRFGKGKELDTLSGTELSELDGLLNETLEGANDGTWMDPPPAS